MNPSTNNRLLSLDAVRGFDMIWILGAEGLFHALFVATGWHWSQLLASQFEHSAWHGLTFYDLIFPLFIFLSGVTLGIRPKYLTGQSWTIRWPIYRKAIIRVMLLCLLGVIYNHGWGQGLPAELNQIRYASVLMRIGVAWFLTAMIVWHCRTSTQWIVGAIILLAYWLVQMYLPTPYDSTTGLSPSKSWNVWFDQSFLPGVTYRHQASDPEGLFSHISAIFNGLAGAYVGQYLHQTANHSNPLRTIVKVLATCLVAVLLGWLWSFIYPLNKHLWTASFALVSAGLSGIIFCIFYWIVDIKQWHKFGTFFAVIGCNAILLYLLTSIFNWKYLVDSLLGGIIVKYSQSIGLLFAVLGLVSVQWLFAKYLFNKRIFLKI